MNIMNQFVLRNLKKNKVRTFVTILGIILATSLFMAVTEGMISFVKFLADWTMETDGAWEVEAMKVPGEKAEELRKVDGVKDSMVMQVLGFHELDEIKNPNKPYLTVMQLEKNYKEFLPGFKLYEGRMAENEHELVVPKHLMDSGGLEVSVGDTVTLETGNRYYKKENISSEVLVVGENQTLAEELGDLKSRTYQIVGICARTTMESKLPEPGYYAFTIGRETGSFSEVYLKAKEPKKAEELVDKIFQQMKSAGESGMVAKINDKLLLYRGEGTSSEAKRLTGILVALVTILIGIVMAASVSMIHDAFAISVSERTKMYGLLKSIGATKRQIRSSVFFEAMVLCVIGIPVGLLCGILGTDLGLRYAGMLFKKILSVPVDTTLHLVFSPAAAFLSAGIGILTILLSAMLPAVRAIHMPAIEALRQSRDIKTERTFGRKQRNAQEKRSSLSKLSYRLFGFSGALAGKNFKRNRKRQRSIVLALTTSVILLVTSVSFCDYLAKMVNSKEEKASYDVYLYLTSGPVSGKKLFREKEALDKVRKQLFNDVEDVSYSRMVDGMILLHRDELTGDCMEQQLTALQKKGEQVLMNVRVVFVEDEGYRKFLRKHHLDEEKYMNPEKLCPLFNDFYHFYDMEKKNTSLGSYFKKDSFSGKLYLLPDEKDGYTYTQEVTLKKDGSVSLG
ncbi:MAG: ABC transporter permease, partial [Lachnospiraceae bacterium]|nr:ABC transporter permease [Lachnospiraceae bacterium]